MFRGGRVDARGTGIASGLGYEAGGRVGYEMGGNIRGGIVNLPGGYDKTGAQRRLDLFKENLAKTKLDQPGSTLYTEPELQQRWQTLKNKMYTGDPAQFGNLDLAYGMQIAPPVGVDEQNFESFIDQYGDEEAYKLWKTGKMPGFEGEDYVTLQEEQRKIYPEKFGEGIEEPLTEEETREAFEARIIAEGDERMREYLAEKMKPGTAEEEIEKNKKIFQKAYGSGVADDASSMLLNFAGKALKPEATVKSAFGEFFEAEGKRPSERKKYKDAATTAAINAYLTGQKDYDSMMKQMKMIEHGVDYKTDKALAVKKSWNLNDYVMNKGTGVSTSQALADGARDKIKLNSEYTGFKKIKSKENTDDLLTDEYVGIIFMDEGTREVFAVIEEDGTVGKRVLYE